MGQLAVSLLPAAVAGRALVRCFLRKHSLDIRRINPKVSREEATAISHNLYQIVKGHGPLPVSNTWNHAKVAKLGSFCYTCIFVLFNCKKKVKWRLSMDSDFLLSFS
ncbi:hypothetical protein MUK42_23418 [Musa troglodytarum]|uniref:Uncharacterized protein n=1 Tax=Musa troglodytarum TaxID=320322 RepID=A0A9E7G3F8_9LILI|nr:hypothetical protein MUK42_23418 [Musa troglodytarum]